MKFSFKNSSKGITLVEIIVVIFIITIFSTILITDFPKIQRQFALSRSAYKLAQDLRKIQGLSLSGTRVDDKYGDQITAVKGYGIYINLNLDGQYTRTYAIYADIAISGDGDHEYNPQQLYEDNLCSDREKPETDCVIEVVKVNQENPSVYIKQINNIIADSTSINFRPPNPIVDIGNRNYEYFDIGIVLGLISSSSAERTVQVNTSGLINVQ